MSLWVGNLRADWSEEYVSSLFASTGKSYKFRLVRDRLTSMSSGYGFLDFESHEDAAEVLRSFSGVPTLRWGGGLGRADQQLDCSVFVGDIDYSLTDDKLLEPFRERYKSAVSAKIVLDAFGTSKGFGFVKFGDRTERDRAVVEMNGFFLGGRQIRVMTAASKEERAVSAEYRPPTMFPSAVDRVTEENSCVFVGGLDESVTPEMLRHHFGLLGDIAYIRIPPGRGCGFVGFVHRKNAESAISTLQGLRINGYKVRLSWGSMRPKNQPAKPSPSQLASQIQQQQKPVVKKEHRTPFGTVTQDFLEDLPDLDVPWQPATHQATAAVEKKQAEAARLVPASPYVAQLKARYRAYRSHIDHSPSSQKDDHKKRSGGDANSFYSTRSSRPCKRRPLTNEEIEAENDLYVEFLSDTLPIFNSGIILPTGPTPSISDLYQGDAITDTDMMPTDIIES